MRTAFTYNIIQRWSFVLVVGLLILMNYLSNVLPFGGMTMAEVSAKYPTLITPAGYSFIIWGLIYLTLAVFAVFQLNRGRETRFFKLIWPYFIVNAFANMAWLVAFQNEVLWLSVILMLVIVGTLVAIFYYFYRLRRALGTTHRYFFQVPFSLYFGWVSIAAFVNVAVFIVSLEIPFFLNHDIAFSVAVLVLGAILAFLILVYQKDYIFSFAVIWAYVAIWVNQQDVSEVMNVAKFSAIALAATMAVKFTANRIKVAQYGRSAG